MAPTSADLTFFPENRHDSGRFILSESGRATPFSDTILVDYGHRSRDQVTLQGGSGLLNAGTLLGKISDNEKYVPSPATDSDGSETAIAILWADIDATGDDDIIVAVVSRAAEVIADKLSYDASVTTVDQQQAKWAQLACLGIIVRANGYIGRS